MNPRVKSFEFVSALFVLLSTVPAMFDVRVFSSSARTVLSDEPLSASEDHYYQLSGAARPFAVFWISRDDVGGGRMSWRHAGEGTFSLELLTGSDPSRAPFGTNRWGFMREVVHGDTVELVGVKSETEEETVDQARASIGREDKARMLVFMRERVTAHESVTWSAIVDVGRPATYRDLDFALDRMATIEDWQERRLARPPGTRPGFLVAFTQLMQAGVAALGSADRAPGAKLDPATKALPYVHRARLYELRQDGPELLRDVMFQNHRYARLLRGRFVLRNPATSSQSRFTVVYGVDGDLTGVPVQITYQPRWWLRTVLTRTESAPFSASN
jgi:hypothetical protein